MGGPEDRITIVPADVTASADALKGIRSEFENCVSNRERLGGYVGSGDIKDALEEFTDNWDRHRGELVERMGQAESTMRSCAASFCEQDRLSADAGQNQITTGPTITGNQPTVTQAPQ